MKTNLKFQVLSLFAILFFAVSINPMAAQTTSFEGDWFATIETQPGSGLRIALHLQPGEPWTGTFDSLDQGALGIALSSVVVEGNVLKFAIDDQKINFEGTLENGIIVGKFRQDSVELPLTFSREAAAPAAEPEKEEAPAEPAEPAPVPEVEPDTIK